VVELEICTWHSSGYDSQVIASPSDDEIAHAIAQLDGGERNDLYLRDISGSWMGIAGGPDRVIVTFAAGEDGPLSQAVDHAAATGPEVEIVVGGQMVTQSPQALFGVKVATDVACKFARTGERSTALTWTEF
jgi:Immunity protein Imm1